MIQSDIAEERLLKVKEVAEMLNLPLSSTYMILANGEIPSVKIGQKTLRVYHSAVVGYLKHRGGAGGTR